ncbi:MAG: 50S ribosomal protein L20 [Deltaproteobacteria bacterium RIFCSPHIGHO2_02_FULL_40_11]|nr:MAG: 50S ribosomal protein L20 [Deltaproteobacteria bacterium RIFCSPHIGHO2_02_FULL_40_11]
MPRVKRGTKARQRRKKMMKLAKGFYSRRKSNFRRGSETVKRGWMYAFRDRKVRKQDFRKLWVIRINAAVRELNMNYSQFMAKFSGSKIALNRKMLADLAATEPQTFKAVVDQVLAA